MTRSGLIVVFVAGLMGAVAASLASPSINSAHQASEWYSSKWTAGTQQGIDTDQVVDWRFVNNFPDGSGFRNRVKDGAAEWNELAPSMRFAYESGAPDANGLGWDDPCPAPTQGNYQADKVGWQEISGSAAAQTYFCPIDGNSLLYFRTRFDKDLNWFGGTGDPNSNELDIWSYSAHEFGHAGGRSKGGDGDGHFPETSQLCPGPSSPEFSDRHTMCGGAYYGTRNERSLEEHDKDVFRNAY